MFPSQPLNPTPFQKTVASRLRNRPFLYFGVPFLSIVVLASYGLQGFTKTRYDYHDTKVQTVSRESGRVGSNGLRGRSILTIINSVLACLVSSLFTYPCADDRLRHR